MVRPFERKENFRLFSDEYSNAQKIIKELKGPDKNPLYENFSQYVRAAVIKLNREKLAELHGLKESVIKKSQEVKE